MFLVLIETSGNQQFIFATNKLRENIGASELTYQATTTLLLEAVDQVFGTQYHSHWQQHKSLTILGDRQLNPPIEQGKGTVEILLATSGKALLLVKEEDKARQLIAIVTKQALIQAPGLEMGGVFVAVDWQQPLGIAAAVGAAHRLFEASRARRPGAQGRFLRLPIVASCNVSELPASGWDYDGAGKKIPLSQVSLAKRSGASAAQRRLGQVDPHLVPKLSDLEKAFAEDLPWLAIVHADGNGFGQILLNLEQYISQPNNRTYIDEYRQFSLALDDCTIAAFKKAIAIFEDGQQREQLPVVPLILGGDDLTVICEGARALEFTRLFLREFEAQTAGNQHIAPIAKKVFGVGQLSACAGVAIVKPHFPFSVAYGLAEELIRSAKQVKTRITTETAQGIVPYPCSAIDFHVLYDSSGIDLPAIRQKLTIDQTQLHNRPYVVSDLAPEAIAPASYQWVQCHSWEKLSRRVAILSPQADGAVAIPSSQSHALRTAIFQGQAVGDGQYRLIRQRYPQLRQMADSDDGESLFRLGREGEEEDKYITTFLDALDAQGFLQPTTRAELGGKS